MDLAALNDQDASVQEKRLKRVHAFHGGAIPPLLPEEGSAVPVEDTGPPKLTDKPPLNGPEYEELKRRLKERKKFLLTLPNFRLKSVGEDASIQIPPNLRTPLFMSDLHKLVTYMIMGNKMPYAYESLRLAKVAVMTFFGKLCFLPFSLLKCCQKNDSLALKVLEFFFFLNRKKTSGFTLQCLYFTHTYVLPL